MYSADEIYGTAELENIPTIPEQHFTDIDIDDIEDEDGDGDLEPSEDEGTRSIALAEERMAEKGSNRGYLTQETDQSSRLSHYIG